MQSTSSEEGMERRHARFLKGLEKVRHGKQRCLKQSQRKKGDLERRTEGQTMTSFPMHNKDTATVHILGAFLHSYSRSSSAPLMSWQRTSAPRHPRVAPSAPVRHPGSCCNRPGSVTAPPYLREQRESGSMIEH